METLIIKQTTTFEQWYALYREPITRHLAQRFQDRHLVEDLLQETFLRAWRALLLKGDIDQVQAYLYRIATNLCVDVARRQRLICWQSLSPDKYFDEGLVTEPQATYGEQEQVHRALACLPKHYRQALLLSQEGYRPSEIANLLGISPKGAKWCSFGLGDAFSNTMRKREREGMSSSQERFTSYRLSELLPEDSKIVLDHELHLVSQLRPLSETCTIVEQQQFTDLEWDLLKEILAAHPYYCPLANLLSAQTGRSLSTCQRVVNRALEEGDLDSILRPVRNSLSRCRVKLRFFGVDIRSMLETGYVLMPDEGSRRNGRGGE